MKKIFLAGLVLLSAQVAFPQTVEYILSMPKPHTHYYEVEMKVKGWNKMTAEVKMPVWAPGSYLVREFAKNVDVVSASHDGGKLASEKIDKNTWRIATNAVKNFTIKYSVYSNELSVRTSFIDDSHAFISGTSVFMYVNGIQQNPGTLKIVPHESFKHISTSLEKKDGVYSFPDYDILADCPIEIGNQDIFYFEAAGVKHEVAMYGEGNHDKDELKKGMARVVEEATKVWGENPNKNYTFIVHNITVSSGGLEHRSSTTLQVNRHSYTGSGLVRFYSLVAHEYFHLWNVKRLRPKALGPFNYDQENYTNLLWVAEGFTSYYDELLLKRAGYYDESSYLRSLSSNFGSIENQPGALVQSVAESSHDAWIKGYRPNENSVNTTISYYPKGSAVAALLDIEIISATKGAKKLDDLLKYMYDEFYKKKNMGYTDEDFISATTKICGKDMRWFFDENVYSAKKMDYNKYLSKVGCTVIETKHTNEPSLDIRTSGGSRVIINNVLLGGSGYEYGLNVNDEIISVDGIRVDENTLAKIIGEHKVGDEIEMLLSRDNIMRTFKIKLGGSQRVELSVRSLSDKNEEAADNYSKWID